MTSRSNRVALLAGLLTFAVAGAAAAVVVVNNTTTAVNPLAVNDTFTVAVRVVWDGQSTPPGLQGIFTSTSYDTSVVEFVSATSAPASILSFVDPDTQDVIPGLNRLLQPTIINGALRTVQYGAGSAEAFVDPRAANAPAGRLITTLTFRAIAAGTTVISGFVAPGDSIAGDTFSAGTTVPITVPEPGSFLLGGAALGAVLSVVAIRRRRTD